MNSFITIELNNFLTEYVRTHTITGDAGLDRRLITILVSLLTTYTAVVLVFGKTFIKDKYNTYFGINNFLNKDKDKVAHIKINCAGNMYEYMKSYVPIMQLNNETNLLTKKNYFQKEISFNINPDGNDQTNPWKLYNIPAKLPQDEALDKITNEGLYEQTYVKYKDRNINITRFYHKSSSGNSGSYYYHLFIEKGINEKIEDIYKIASQLLMDAKNHYYKKNKNVKYDKIELYEIIESKWKNTAILNEKTNETMVGQKCKDIFADVNFFEKDLNKVYKALDIPFKRGYLLYGPPGTGKTSVIKSVASYTKKSIYKITFNEHGLGDDDYKKLLADTPINSIVLIEDVDPKLLQEGGFIDKSIIINTKSKDKDKDNNESMNITEQKSRVSYNTILDALDGINPNSGRITFITTNHPNKMGKALLRPGRIDKKYKLDYIINDEIIDYFKMYYNYFKIDEKKIVECANQFIKNIRDHKKGGAITFAQLQQYLVQYLDNINDAVANTQSMFENEEYDEYV